MIALFVGGDLAIRRDSEAVRVVAGRLETEIGLAVIRGLGVGEVAVPEAD